MLNKIWTVTAMLVCMVATSGQTFAAERPNVILVFIDDMGWGDFSCFGNPDASTPNIDAMAAEGIRFEQFYVNSPICSPSRVAISTGQYPQRHRITSYLNNRRSNRQRGVADWLSPEAPMLARSLQDAGYATAHCGKWHMGGQRDVDDAPPISDYGFDTSLTNFEGMGAKLLPLTETPTKDGGVKKGRIWEDAERLGEPVTWMLRSKITGGFTDKAIEFIDQAQAADQPFYINVWPDDVHAPFFPSIEGWKDGRRGLYLSVLEEMDAQFGRLFERIKDDEQLRENTLVLICSDNGPDPGAGSAGPLRGNKATLFEGGVRSPLVVWGPSLMDADAQGTLNDTSVFSAIDLVPSLLTLTDVAPPSGVEFDGEDLASVLVGKSTESREQALFFRRPPDRKAFARFKNLPDLAVRDGEWKLLCDYDGGRQRLFNVEKDPGESTNVATGHPEVTERLTKAVLSWNSKMPADAGDPNYVAATDEQR
ncbi:sulfatase-like hydrolase/transferase [Allorhodopirellula solitaria]|uniref:Arylsulfatase n=1 Tax=Allorhodopirellula solitaria TaxID=2527987 RepID=A0A5C5XVR6_9BACT|nr:sulfatase-like hydrolase/transferase [Allorhodopirellula solitaria]TWT67426.1 Arylsulfatase precursor [Allorhodopirellula solitaria]